MVDVSVGELSLGIRVELEVEILFEFWVVWGNEVSLIVLFLLSVVAGDVGVKVWFYV